MADDEQSTSGMVSGLAQVFVAQLRAVTEGLENLAGSGERLPPSARSALLLPGALSVAQVTSIADSVAAQRRSIEAFKAQLSAFDEQLAVLEQILGPFAEWSRTWADLEEQLVTMRRRPEAEGSLPPLPIPKGVSSDGVRNPGRPGRANATRSRGVRMRVPGGSTTARSVGADLTFTKRTAVPRKRPASFPVRGAARRRATHQ